MNTLLSVEEYHERAINVVMETAMQNIAPNATDYFKYEFIYFLAQEALTDHFMRYDVANQMFIKVFMYDRNGKIITLENIKQIDKKEIKEFNSQPRYVEYNKKRKKNWQIIKELYWTPKKEDFMIILKDVLALPFKEDINSAYKIANEAFKRLYGHDYQIDKDFQAV